MIENRKLKDYIEYNTNDDDTVVLKTSLLPNKNYANYLGFNCLDVS